MIETSWDTTVFDLEPVRLGFIGAGAMARFAVYPALHFAPIRTENYRDEYSGELTGDAGSWREFASAIRQGREPVCNIHENVKTMELYQALYDAATAGRSGVVYSP